MLYIGKTLQVWDPSGKPHAAMVIALGEPFTPLDGRARMVVWNTDGGTHVRDLPMIGGMKLDDWCWR